MTNTVTKKLLLKNGNGIIIQSINEDSIQVIIRNESNANLIVTDIFMNSPYLSDTTLLTIEDSMYDFYSEKLDDSLNKLNQTEY